ncbi:hypothetical protein K503DRAFT_869562 [Rhizopogon vinicolor AM-OR11-026]|uniref:G-protein coupled receptors family 3 profile domain-containing protein n=1 Tax=Rhizopogon vinicolor AM-OR11-026 TaxID=1314800 RepID=A0A1B7MLC6_9AGAM|nr:hypothetical protein K503DRAFT_869562 [Rhizopogon vinicolor AM-OR11-026]
MQVIMITRLHVMYQQSRKMLIFLIVTFLALTIALGVLVVMISSRLSGEELILSDSHQCIILGYEPLLSSVTWVLGTAWEVLALCLAAWIAVKHFRELQRRPTGSVIGDCLTVLIKSHMFYFAGFTAVSCLTLSHALLSRVSNSLIFVGFAQIAFCLQVFVLGPRLILSIREYHAKLVVKADAGIDMTTFAFQSGIPISTASGGDDV